MRVDEVFPAEWGRTLVGAVSQDEDGEWFFAEWEEITFPSAEDGRHHHHTAGSVSPDTVAIAFGEEIVALGETGGMDPTNLYVSDYEYYQFLRLREVLDPERWALLPWAPFQPGRVLHAWDKFHALDYFRHPDLPPVPYGYEDRSMPGYPAVMSYGGDWYDFAQQVESEYPLGYRAEPVASSEACLIRAAQDGDLAAVLEQLSLGTDPNTGAEPPGVHTAFCSEKDATPVATPLNRRWTEITDALVAAGARIPPYLAHLYAPTRQPESNPRPEWPARPDPLRPRTGRSPKRQSGNGIRRWWQRVIGR
ncbi:hypothetical protein KHQ06_33570 [Nocardia tengchongensis]|uniref:Ankyrin n=1 Tax=Nocardia tengchongensis TaxID=2055889 RepID=A0ABX8CNH6_9NOCA|nr:hypothetical protein [Nocardia tengchongensis]QVI20952.1 hypothetical protein KHQ06_33570 [Nocardia tengchongensis]